MISLPFTQSTHIEAATSPQDDRRDSAAPDGGRTTVSRRRMQIRRPAARGPRAHRSHDRCPHRS